MFPSPWSSTESGACAQFASPRIHLLGRLRVVAKRGYHQVAMNFFATAARGTEDLCGAELRALGATAVDVRGGGVSFAGPADLGWRACLWLRTAMRVLVPLAEYEASGPDALYEGAKAVDWSEHLTLKHT